MNDENLTDISSRPDHKELSAKGGTNKKGSKSFKVMMRQILTEKDPDGEWAKLPAFQLFKKAFEENNLKALVEILDRIEGPIKKETDTNIQQVVIMGEIKKNDKPLRFNIGEEKNEIE